MLVASVARSSTVAVALLAFVAAVLGAAGVAACGGDPARPTIDTRQALEHVDPSGAGPADAAIVFEPCSLRTGGDDGRAECASVKVPLDWSVPDAPTVVFFVKRIRGTSAGTHRQLWLLQGGPGNAGDGLEPLAEQIAAVDPSLDVYVPDHRGTGRSTRLDCPSERGRMTFDYARCLTELKQRWGTTGLATFNTTTAARDVGYVIEHTRRAGQEVHVYGMSYGTYWAQRYLQLFPTQPTAMVLDGVCQSGLCSYLKSSYWFDRVGRKYMAECAADEVCGAKLGADPVAKVRDAIARANAKTCAGLERIDGESLRRVFAWFIASFELRALVPSTTFRVLRCNDDDVEALRHLEDAILETTGTSAVSFTDADVEDLSSDVLGLNIAFSELEEDPPASREALGALLEDGVFARPDTGMRDAYDAWPRYPRDAWVGQYPHAEVPVLLMNGTLDPQTPQEFAETVAPHYARLDQRLVLLPRAAHVVVHQSPVAEAGAPTCGMTLWQQFLHQPTLPLDTSCDDRILPHDFAGSQALAERFFGRTTLWGSATEAAASPELHGNASATGRSPETAAALSEELRRAARATRPWLRTYGVSPR